MKTNTPAIPAPPPGYQQAIPFEYPKMKLQLLSIVLLILIAPFLLFITWFLQGQPRTSPLVINGGVLDFLLIFVTIIITVIVHELIHGLTYQLLGYQVTYGASLHLFAAYAAAFGQWQKRNHNILVALTPLFILSLLLLPLLSVSNSVIVLIAFTAILFNIGGAVGDIYLTWRLLNLPPTALLYDVDVSTMLIFVPLE